MIKKNPAAIKFFLAVSCLFFSNTITLHDLAAWAAARNTPRPAAIAAIRG